MAVTRESSTRPSAAHLAWRDLIFQLHDNTQWPGRRCALSVLACRPADMLSGPDMQHWTELSGLIRREFFVADDKRIVLAVMGHYNDALAFISEQSGLDLLYTTLVRLGERELRELREVFIEVRLENGPPLSAWHVAVEFAAPDVGRAVLTAKLRAVLRASAGARGRRASLTVQASPPRHAVRARYAGAWTRDCTVLMSQAKGHLYHFDQLRAASAAVGHSEHWLVHPLLWQCPFEGGRCQGVCACTVLPP